MKHQVLIKKMCKFNTLITALCFLFLIKQRWHKKKIFDFSLFWFVFFVFNQRALCSIGIVNFVFMVSAITSRRGIIENIKNGQISREGSIFCVVWGEGGSSQKITTIKRERASEKIVKLRGGHAILKWCFPNDLCDGFK